MYKYLRKKYADQLFNENGIRIGTLNWYRDMENKKGISDPLGLFEYWSSFCERIFCELCFTGKFKRYKSLI